MITPGFPLNCRIQIKTFFDDDDGDGSWLWKTQKFSAAKKSLKLKTTAADDSKDIFIPFKKTLNGGKKMIFLIFNKIDFTLV